MECPRCGHENIAGADACEECQTDLTHLDAPKAKTPLERGIMEHPLRSVAAVEPPKVAPDASLRDVVARLLDADGAVLVVQDGSLLGIFSERDLLMKIGERYDELADRPISEFMTPAPESLGGADPIAFALNRMDVGHFRHIPIVESEGPTAMVSIRDILKHLADAYPDVLKAT